MMDDMPVVRFCDYLTQHSYGDVAALDGGATVARSKANLDALASAHEMQVQSFWGYSAGAIKKMGYSPYAFVQMAIQLATYRLWGVQGGTYEATQGK